MAINLVDKFPFEIISVDSVMVYKDCNIGSAKPNEDLLKKYPHHLVNQVSLDEIFTVAEFYKLSKQLIKEIHKKDKIPLFVGGTMMYFKSLYDGIHDLPLRDDEYRSKLKKMYSNNDLYDLLKKVDPDYAKKLDANDELRILRALEINKNTGKPLVKFYKRIQKNLFPKTMKSFSLELLKSAL